MTAKSAAAVLATQPGGGTRRMLFRALLCALVVASWAALWLWSASPYGRYLEHGGWAEIGALAPLCRAIPQGQLLVPASLHALGWVLMIGAMMLPTTFPLVEIFRRVVGERRDAGRLVALVVLGFFVAWFAFGVIAHAADEGLHLGALSYPWLVIHGWIIGAAVLIAAGLFQFSALKYRCLEKCRTPLGFVVARWHGKSSLREAFCLGLDHGAFCVGCCWALMLLMFVVGTASIGWMLALGAVMAIEKNMPWGRKISAPLGVILIGWGALIVVNHTWSWQA